mgnify:CR=1 FL=1
MKKFLKIQQILAIILVASIALAGASCKKKKEDPPVPGIPPTLPPIESLKMDFSDFNSLPSKGSAKIIQDTYENYTEAYNNVNFWKDLLQDDLLAIPVAGLANALTRTGQEVTTNTFEWSLSFNANLTSYLGTLTATKGSTTFTITLSAAPSASPSSTFQYLYGEVSNDLSTADWQVNKNDGGSVAVLDGLYTYNATSGFESLEYTYTETGQAESMSTIEFNVLTSGDYDAAFYMSLSAGNVDVEWDTTTRAGRVKSPAAFTDTNWHYWNDVLADFVPE